MHAVLIPVTFNDRAAAEKDLPELVSQVSEMPGFVAGYWVAMSDEKGTAMIVFESEDGAKELADRARETEPGAVSPENIEVGEVLAHK